MVLVAVCLTAGLLVLLLLGFVMFYLWRRARDRRQYQDLVAAVPPIPVCTAPVLLVSQGSWVKPAEIPFTLPPLFTTPNQINLETEEGEEKVEVMKMDVLTHRGSLSVQSWYPVGTVLAGLYSNPALSKVVAPPPGIATRLCFSVEYRYSSEQLAVSLLRLGNLPPRFHGNVTLVQLRLLPEDRRPRQAKARCTGPDPEFNECFLFQVSGGRVTRSTLSVCVLSVSHDSKRHAVGRVLFPLQGELGQAGRVLWRDLETEDHNHCSEWGDMLVSLCYSPSLQRLSVEVVRARGLQLLTDSGGKSSGCHVNPDNLDHLCVLQVCVCRMTFKLRAEHMDEACLQFVVQQPHDIHSEPSIPLGLLVLGPFMYARGPQLQHWMDMVNTAQEPVKVWHGLGRAT
ncbi:synaptotagmin-15 isoform X3 [Dunckerocampus dactyliophorus]|uniref:synaptotagmin-15 isoform X3 n=1 Tax=Dunckerocampus dactyliophorus TaxID=161453 RepID=UPI002406CEE0|nr:synaptotagmin-15 isoform X3 [Dunckerocampus dactyliophorus]